MSKKKKYYEAKGYIEGHKYNLLSDNYSNAHEKIKLQCPKGHVFEMKFNNFQQGQRCPECKKEKSPMNKLSYEYVKNYIESLGYSLLSSEYVNSSEKLKIRCKNNHIFHMSWSNLTLGKKCIYCNGKRHYYDDVKRYVEKEGYELLNQNDENINYRKLMFRCKNGHVFNTSYWNFKKNQRCKKCASRGLRICYNDVKECIEKEGYELLSKKYINNKHKLKLRCNNNHICHISFSDFKNAGKRCGACYYESCSSKAEKEIQYFISMIYNNNIINNDRNTIINPQTGWNLELDIYLPDINKAIEFNGTYWHSLDKAQLYDKIKKEQCKQKSIDLLVINENEWNNNKEKCLNKIRSFIDEN